MMIRNLLDCSCLVRNSSDNNQHSRHSYDVIGFERRKGGDYVWAWGSIYWQLVFIWLLELWWGVLSVV